jgi:hypothetical protein
MCGPKLQEVKKATVNVWVLAGSKKYTMSKEVHFREEGD